MMCRTADMSVWNRTGNKTHNHAVRETRTDSGAKANSGAGEYG